MIKVTGNLHDGKYYSADGRWAKIMVTKFITMPTMITCALGYNYGYNKAFVVNNYTKKSDAVASAKTWCDRGVEVY